MRKDLVVTVLGDLNVELFAQLDDVAFEEVGRDTLSYCPVEVSVGGTAANFALASRKHFGVVHVIGKLGDDEFGKMVAERLAAEDIQLHCGVAPAAPTGLGIYVRDANKRELRGVRLLMIRAESANHALGSEDVEMSSGALLRSDLLMLDGYCFLRQPRRGASFRAMEIARRNGVKVAVDIVPHDAYTLYDFDSLKSIVELADVLIVELGTIRNFMGLNVPCGVLEKELALETAGLLRDEFPGKTFYLRFGVGGIDQSLCCHAGKEPEHSFTGYASATCPRGFGDRLAARELAELLNKQ